MAQNPTGKSLIDPGFFGTSADNIIVQRNFIEKDDINRVQHLVEMISRWDDAGTDMFNDEGECIYDSSYWKDRVCTDLLGQGDLVGAELYAIVSKYTSKMKAFLEDRFNLELAARTPAIVRWMPGFEQSPHADKQLNDGSPNPFYDYDLNSVFYWNDDFEGGQLYYPQHGIEVEIEAGTAISHPGDIHYLHGVKKVLSGRRWTTPAFFTVTKIL